MVVEELDKSLCRKPSDFGTGRGPDGRSHGDQVVVYEYAAEAVALQILSEGFIRQVLLFQVLSGRFEKTEHIPNHPVEPGLDQDRRVD